jgi:hypothetical protein
MTLSHFFCLQAECSVSSKAREDNSARGFGAGAGTVEAHATVALPGTAERLRDIPYVYVQWREPTRPGEKFFKAAPAVFESKALRHALVRREMVRQRRRTAVHQSSKAFKGSGVRYRRTV